MDICGALSERRIVHFDYEGHHRVVELAAHGPHAQSGNAVVRGYQVGGTGETRPVPFWDMYRLDRIENFEIQAEHFSGFPPNYVLGDAHINPIHCQLERNVPGSS
jgi:hypothetical protein